MDCTDWFLKIGPFLQFCNKTYYNHFLYCWILFANIFHIYSTCKWSHTVIVFYRIFSLSTIFSKSTHIAVNGKISFSKGWVIFHCIQVLNSPLRLHQFIFPPTLCHTSLFSTPLPICYLCRVFDDSHSDLCEVISLLFWFAFLQ